MSDKREADRSSAAGRFPPYVETVEQRRRWELAEGIAVQLFGDTGDPGNVWLATRSIYNSDIPTDG